MYSTCNPSLPTVMLPCTSVILVFPASLPGFVSAPSSQLSQAGFVPTPAQSKLGLHHHSTSWAPMCCVPASAGSISPCICVSRHGRQLFPAWQPQGQLSAADTEGRIFLSSCAERSSTDKCDSQGCLAPNKL